jgi:lipid-binding SYLF domain-containing protein
MHRGTRSPCSRRSGVVPFPVGLVTAALALVACSTVYEPAQSPAERESQRVHALGRLDDSAAVVIETRSQIPDDVAASARCVVIVPAVSKAGLLGAQGLGGGPQFGRGVATCHTGNGWSAPAPVRAQGAWVGVRIGFQHIDVVALLTSGGAVRALESGKFEVGVSASAAAGPTGAGRGRELADVVTYSRSSGVFAGASLEGMNLESDEGPTQVLYGSRVAMSSILEGRVPRPQDTEAARFSTAIRKAFPRTPEVSQSNR